MAIQRSYPRLLDNSVASVQKALNQAFDYIFQLQAGSNAATSGSKGSVRMAVATATLPLVLGQQDIPGCSLELEAGDWLIIATFGFQSDAFSGYAIGRVAGPVTGTIWSGVTGATAKATVSGAWHVRLTEITTLKLVASSGFNVAGAFAFAGDTRICAIKGSYD